MVTAGTVAIATKDGANANGVTVNGAMTKGATIIGTTTAVATAIELGSRDIA
jgi:hypothetical protein